MTTPAIPSRIGIDLWPFGRIARVFFGLFAIAAAIAEMVTGDHGTGYFVQVAVYIAAMLAYYLVLHGVLGERVLGRISPFLASVLVLGPVFGAIAVLPGAIYPAVELYVGASLILTAAIGYGGCELISVSTLLFGRRYVVYCPNNILDAAERPMRRTGDPVVRGAAITALLVATYFLIADPLLDEYVAKNVIPGVWALLLLVPAAVLAERAWRRRTQADRAFGLALGAAALAVGAFILAGLLDEYVVFWAVIVAGLLFAGYRAMKARRSAEGSPSVTT
jgi:Family of unknown function (DUF6410)